MERFFLWARCQIVHPRTRHSDHATDYAANAKPGKVLPYTHAFQPYRGIGRVEEPSASFEAGPRLDSTRLNGNGKRSGCRMTQATAPIPDTTR
jgi:hypothetical protein